MFRSLLIVSKFGRYYSNPIILIISLSHLNLNFRFNISLIHRLIFQEPMMVCDGKKLLTTLVRDLIALMALAILMASICCCIALSHRKRMAVVVAIHYTP